MKKKSKKTMNFVTKGKRVGFDKDTAEEPILISKRVCMPPYADEETDAKIQMAKMKINAEIQVYAKKGKGSENSYISIKKGSPQSSRENHMQ